MPKGAAYWIDGYNVLLRLKLGEGATLAERRAELLARLAASGMAAWVAFDSREIVHGARESLPRRIEVAFAREGGTADSLLIQKVQRAPDLSGVIVVSDDRQVVERCGFLGARTMGCTQFGRMLKPATPGTPRKERPLSRGEVDDWMKWFGYEKESGERGRGDAGPSDERGDTDDRDGSKRRKS